MPRDPARPRYPPAARFPPPAAPRRRPPPAAPPRPPRWLTVNRGEPGRRVGITLLVIAIVLTLFAGRLVQLQGMESGYYKAAAAAEQVRVNPLPALRGTIYGANGQPLAMTIETYTVTADPPQIPDADKPSVAQELAGPLGLTAAQVLSLLRHPSSPDYVQLATGVSTANEAKIEALDIPGVVMTPTFVRAYPDGSATANLVGFTNVNPKTGVISGQSGIEAEYNTPPHRHHRQRAGDGRRGRRADPAGGHRGHSPPRTARPSG